ncbi:hypothetical protein B0T26DRAFT_783757 [Lasiosphaeria miniovina]|uniref:Heterokaryon incompatibility domain-containing protein n=1 Tax=Lasiosphaeria miniovina TaxID=1954250 RepID=A0AA40ADU7_9PEZI|nr:uncharacterized protein B0T26DRAFT_783757 [Lasiosphaeria miniovina]KAK0713957.1 hypothetical protein B0T26DRAFT_783757 [Lasiosphaeria miniovina]
MKLFVISPDCAPEDQRLHINGTGWGLLEQETPSTLGTLSDFLCVSYTWGAGRFPSPFHPEFKVSDRTLCVLLTAIVQHPTARKIWIDAFCVPPPSEPSLRASTLQSMGFIYSRASEVLVVLTSAAIPVLQQASRSHHLSPFHLSILEAEDWVTRAWTYQEAVNACQLRIVCTNPKGFSSSSVLFCLRCRSDMMSFFSLLGSSLGSLTPAQRKLYPRLSSLEDLFADCAVAKYLERSALQVMTIMDGRTQTQPEDHFYAMMGAISIEPTNAVEEIGPCEAFMRLCERKGDYSFLFCKEDRDEGMGRMWRPVGCELRPLIKWHSWGGGLRGSADRERVVLEGIAVLELGKLGERARTFIEGWLLAFERMNYGSWPDLETERAAYEALRVLEFSGNEEYLATECGLVFPQNPAPQSAQVKVIVAVGIRWTLGSPALIQFRDDASSDEYFYEPGVFFGQVPDGGVALRNFMLC